MLFDIIQANYACFLICILFIFFAATNHSFDESTKNYFVLCICVPLLLTVVDSIELINATFAQPTFARKLCSAVGYILRPVTAMFIILIMQRNKPRKTRKRRLLSYLELIPFAANTLFCLLSIFNGCVFAYTPNNLFLRGPLWLLPFLTAGFYVCSMLVWSIVSLRVMHRSETVMLLLIGFLCVGGTVMESVYHFDGTLNTACAIGTVFYYLYLHVHLYSTDPLTFAYNRRVFYIDAAKPKKQTVIIAELDLNNLKLINDHQGHAAGDLALTQLATTVQAHLPHHCTLYRIGGDEFTVLFRGVEQDKIRRVFSDIQAELTPYNITFAYGFSTLQGNESADACLHRADEEMYNNKAAFKAEKT